jgi:hypothetical protein
MPWSKMWPRPSGWVEHCSGVAITSSAPASLPAARLHQIAGQAYVAGIRSSFLVSAVVLLVAGVMAALFPGARKTPAHRKSQAREVQGDVTGQRVAGDGGAAGLASGMG